MERKVFWILAVLLTFLVMVITHQTLTEGINWLYRLLISFAIGLVSSIILFSYLPRFIVYLHERRRNKPRQRSTYKQFRLAVISVLSLFWLLFGTGVYFYLREHPINLLLVLSTAGLVLFTSFIMLVCGAINFFGFLRDKEENEEEDLEVYIPAP